MWSLSSIASQVAETVAPIVQEVIADVNDHEGRLARYYDSSEDEEADAAPAPRRAKASRRQGRTLLRRAEREALESLRGLDDASEDDGDDGQDGNEEDEEDEEDEEEEQQDQEEEDEVLFEAGGPSKAESVGHDYETVSVGEATSSPAPEVPCPEEKGASLKKVVDGAAATEEGETAPRTEHSPRAGRSASVEEEVGFLHLELERAYKEKRELSEALEGALADLGAAHEEIQQRQAGERDADSAAASAAASQQRLAALEEELALERERSAASATQAKAEREEAARKAEAMAAEMERAEAALKAQLETLASELAREKQEHAVAAAAAAQAERELDVEAKRFDVELVRGDDGSLSRAALAQQLGAKVSRAFAGLESDEEAEQRARELLPAFEELAGSQAANQTVPALEAAREAAEKRATEAERAREEGERAKRASDEAVCALQARAEQLEKALAQAQSEVETERANHQSLLAEQRERSESLEEAAGSASHQLRALQDDKDSLQRRLDVLSSSFDKLQESARATLESEQALQAQCTEYEATMDDLESALESSKRALSQSEAERQRMRQQVENLQEDLRKRTNEHKRGVNTLTGQLGEIERLRAQLAELQDREGALHERVQGGAGVQQEMHKLSGELQAARGELRVAEADRARLADEKKNLSMALGQINKEMERQAAAYERKIEQLNKRLSESQAAHDDERAGLQKETARLAASEKALATRLGEVEQANEHLRASLEALESRPLSRRSSTASSLASGQLQRSSSLASMSPAELGPEQTFDARMEPGPADSVPGGESEAEGEGGSVVADADDAAALLDRGVIRKLVVKYFEQKRAGTFHAQQEMLNLLANLLDMDRPERELLGLVKPEPGVPRRRASRDSGIQLPPGVELPQVGDEQSEVSLPALFSKLLFGQGEAEDSDLQGGPKKSVDWEAMEQAVTSKPFAELFEDVLREDL